MANDDQTTVNRDAGRDERPVRRATPNDAAAIARIYNTHVDLGGATFDTAHWTDTQVERLLICEPPQAWFVGEIEGQVVGWAAVRWYSLRYGYRFTLESAIYVDPESIGKGISHRLQEAMERHCRQANVHHLVAKIAADNDRSIAFHYRHGFEMVGVQKGDRSHGG